MPALQLARHRYYSPRAAVYIGDAVRISAACGGPSSNRSSQATDVPVGTFCCRQAQWCTETSRRAQAL
eukprot:1396557-Pyramimonas_sp.AAC.1